jgi:two-component system, NarL family, response regulator NreC
LIRLVIADDHAIVREGLRALLGIHSDMTVVAEASDGHQALDAVRRCAPDVLVIDLTMPTLGGLEAIVRVNTAAPRTRILVLTMHSAPEFVRPAIDAGAHGYVVKGAGLDRLVDAIRAVAAGEHYLDSSAASVVAHDALSPGAPPDDVHRLTPREREILQLVAEGRTNGEIADQLGLAAKTVDTHRTNLMRKLNLHSAQAVTRFAIRRGLVSSE